MNVRGLGIEDYRPLLERVLERMQQALGADLLGVALYGSIARHQARPESDIDLIIVHRGDWHPLLQKMIQIEFALAEEPVYQALARQGIRSKIFPVFFSEARLATDIPWLFLDVQDHGIILYDPEGVLQRTLHRLRQRLKELGSCKVVLEDGSWYWDLKPDWKAGEVFEL